MQILQNQCQRFLRAKARKGIKYSVSYPQPLVLKLQALKVPPNQEFRTREFHYLPMNWFNLRDLPGPPLQGGPVLLLDSLERSFQRPLHIRVLAPREHPGQEQMPAVLDKYLHVPVFQPPQPTLLLPGGVKGIPHEVLHRGQHARKYVGIHISLAGRCLGHQHACRIYCEYLDEASVLLLLEQGRIHLPGQRLGEDQEGLGRVGRCGAREYLDVLSRGIFLKRLHQGGLADARFPADKDCGALAILRVLKGLSQGLQFLFSADERMLSSFPLHHEL